MTMTGNMKEAHRQPNMRQFTTAPPLRSTSSVYAIYASKLLIYATPENVLYTGCFKIPTYEKSSTWLKNYARPFAFGGNTVTNM